MEDENLDIQSEDSENTEEIIIESMDRFSPLFKLLLYTAVFNVLVGILNLIDSFITFKNISLAWNREFFQNHKFIDTTGTTITFLIGLFMLILGINIYTFTSAYKKDIAENPDDISLEQPFILGLRKYFSLQLFVLIMLLLKVIAVLYIRLF
ncbi:MAG: hypothetical protein ABSG15_05855 [FCB group bacterium]|jgi:hypothetical protein